MGIVGIWRLVLKWICFGWVSLYTLTSCETTPPVDPARIITHPTASTQQATQQLLMEHPLSSEELQTCWKQVQETMGKIVDERDLLHAKKQISQAVSADHVTYHWCFYHMVDDLDRRVRSDAKPLSDRVSAFYTGMETLWALARALDDASAVPGGKVQYFPYLLDRYQEISRDVLGREVMPQGHPLDAPREKELKEIESRGK